MTEHWKPIPGYEGFYEVSNTGIVRSMTREVPHGLGEAYRHVKGQVMSSKPANNGYPAVMLSRQGGKKLCTVHRLVMLAFIGPCPGNQEVAHADGNRLNPCLENLRYATRKENVADAVAHGTAPHGYKNKGAKLTPAQVAAIRSDTRSLAKIASEYGISRTSVSNVKNHKTYSP